METRNHHAVQFYGSDAALFQTAGGFLAEGLVTNHPALVIATPEHRLGLLAELRRRLIDVDVAVRSGFLVLLDAEEMLESFMTGDVPDPRLFENTVGAIVAATVQAAAPGMTVRAYGEMVDVLWQQGRTTAAVKLELLWNSLAHKHRFALLCGYSMGQFYKRAAELERICDLHSHVLEDEALTSGPESAVTSAPTN